MAASGIGQISDKSRFFTRQKALRKRAKMRSVVAEIATFAPAFREAFRARKTDALGTSCAGYQRHAALHPAHASPLNPLLRLTYYPRVLAGARRASGNQLLLEGLNMSRVSVFSSPLLLGFDEVERLLDRAAKTPGDGYPPYNIERLPAACRKERPIADHARGGRVCQ